MSTTLPHPDALIRVDELPDGRKRLSVTPEDPSKYIKYRSCETAYPIELIELILRVKGPDFLCDEIMRDESPTYVENNLRTTIFAYFDPAELDGRRILDFGCGSGASSMVLARMFPRSEIVGIELERELLSVAEARAKHYGLDRVRFYRSSSGTEIPAGIGTFDLLILSAVYEHLLPAERKELTPKIWRLLYSGGVLIVEETPHRYSPLESHTTGLPLINYLPDFLALRAARRFSRRVARRESWESLLRRGIRGSTAGEIMADLRATGDGEPVLLAPGRMNIRDEFELWYRITRVYGNERRRKYLARIFRALKLVTGYSMVPYITLAIRKERASRSDVRAA